MGKLRIKSKSGLRVFSNENIRSWGPCYDPKRYFEDETTRHTAVSILQDPRISFGDRLWVVLRTDLCSKKMMRLAAVWFYRDTFNWVKNPDPRSIEAANVAERFAFGQATKAERSAAQSAAKSAAWSAQSAAWSAAQSAAKSAAWSAAESAAWSAGFAAWSAARSAAWSAGFAAWAAAQSAAESAAWSAGFAAWSAAQSAESAAQSAAQQRYTNKLVEMFLAEGQERLEKNRGKK